jgi:hypothetical protein
MENPPDVPTFEHRVLAELRAIRRQLDDIEKRVKSIEQEAARVRRAVKAWNFKLTHYRESQALRAGKSVFSSPMVLCMVHPPRVLAAFPAVRRNSGLRADYESLFPPRTCKN